jgi:cell division protein YceG involved in septum cleavage
MQHSCFNEKKNVRVIIDKLLISFNQNLALFKDKWADNFKCDRAEMVTMFSRIFKESHIHNE